MKRFLDIEVPNDMALNCSLLNQRKKDATFKPEDSFPRFLLQWIRHSKKVDGIKHFSVRINFSSDRDFAKLLIRLFRLRSLTVGAS
jgi:hypothetical protein